VTAAGGGRGGRRRIGGEKTERGSDEENAWQREQ
jgi:hypothetical protein